jgi:hypothetical protein
MACIFSVMLGVGPIEEGLYFKIPKLGTPNSERVGNMLISKQGRDICAIVRKFHISTGYG